MENAHKLEFTSENNGNLVLNCCGWSKTEPLHCFGPAVKPYYLIHYVLSGKGKFVLNEKEYPLEAGFGFLIEPEQLVFYQADEKDPWTYVWVGFGGIQATEYVHNMGMSVKHPIFCSKNDQELHGIVKDMMEHNTYSVSNILRRNGLLSIFLSVLSESTMLPEKNDAERANNYVIRAIEFIQANYCNPIKVTDVADYVCINRSYLYTLFQNHMKMSPQQFLTMFRITKSMELLQVTSFSVETIALSCGYNDPIVFTKAFKQTKKMSPSQYRKELNS